MNTIRRRASRPLVAVFTLALALNALSGCEKKGPAEELGEKVDEAVQDGKRAVEDAQD